MKTVGIVVVMCVILAGCASSGLQAVEEASRRSGEVRAAPAGAEENGEAVSDEAELVQAGTENGEPMVLFDGDERVYPYSFVLREVIVREGAMPATAFTAGMEARVALMGECFPGTLVLEGSERWSAEVEVQSEYGEVSVAEVTLGREAQRLPEEVRACLVGVLTRVRLSEEMEEGAGARVRVDFAVRGEE